jgi:preprotein translocase subunit SecG
MLDLLHTPLTVLHVFVCLMLMLVVLIQPGKSGGLGAALGGAGATQIFGGRGAGNFLTRTTWIAASIFFLTSVTLAYLSTSTGDSLEDLAKSSRSAPAGNDTGNDTGTATGNDTGTATGTATGKAEDVAPAESAAPAPADQAPAEPAAPSAPAPAAPPSP